MIDLKIKISLFFLFQMFMGAMASSEEYSVNQLIELGINRSKQIAAADLEAQSKERAAIQAGRWENPSLELGIGKREQFGGSAQQWRTGLSQTIGIPGRYSLREEVVEADAKVFRVNVESTALDLRYKLFRDIYAFKSAEEKAKHAEERLKRFREVHVFLSSRPFASPQKRTEANIVKGKIQVLQRDLLRLKTDRDALWEELNLYLGLREKPSIKSEWYKSGPDIRFESLLSKIDSNNPELKKQRLMVERSELQIQLSKNEAWPALTLSGYYGNGSGSDPEKTYGLGVSIPLPVFNANQSAIQSAHFKKDAELSRLSFEQESLQKRIKSEFLRFQSAKQAIQALPISLIPDLESSMNLADRGFRKGQVDLLTYIEADTQHSESLAAIYDAQVEFVGDLSELLLMAGEIATPGER